MDLVQKNEEEQYNEKVLNFYLKIFRILPIIYMKNWFI